VHQVRLGRTGLMVSAVGFGGIPIQRLSEDDAVAVVRHCLDRGVNFIDTANGYTTSEERIGKALEGRREGLIIASKSFTRDGERTWEHIELSLERLGVEVVDIYQVHGVNNLEDYQRVVASGGPLDAIREAQAAGVVRYIGVSSHELKTGMALVRSGYFDTILFPFNCVSNEAAEELIPLAAKHDVGFLAMKPMEGGMLEDATIAFKYLRRFANVIPVVGIQRTEEIDEIVAVMEGPAAMSAAEEAELVRLREELGKRFCRRCGYCMPCPQGINISAMVGMESFAKRLPLKSLLEGWRAEAVETAKSCIKCGECEEKCPYGLPIREMIEEGIAFWHKLQGEAAG